MSDNDDEATRFLVRNNMLIMGAYVSTVTESQIIDQALYDVQQTNQLKVEYSTEEIAQHTNLSLSSSIYETLHKAVEHFLNCKIILHDAKQKKTEGFVLVTYCCYDKGILSLEINRHVLPYLINPAPPFTKTDLSDIKKFGGERKSKNFALRLYEIISPSLFLLDKMTRVEKYFSLEEFKIRTGLVREINDQLLESLEHDDFTSATLNIAGDLYPSWGDLKRRILDPAIAEINKKQPYILSYKTRCGGRGRKVLGITFCIQKAIGSQDIEKNEQPEIAPNDTDLISVIRNMITEPLSNKDIKSIIDAAGGSIERVSVAYSAACQYKARQELKGKKIDTFPGLMIAAIKEEWATSPTVSTNTQYRTPKKGWSDSQHHLKKHGFENNIYNFDELEKEIVSNY